MASNDDWTIGRLLDWTTNYLKQHQAESPRLDAELLLAEALGCERIGLYTSFKELAPEEARTAFRALVRRRADGEPVAYLLGFKEFFSATFRVTPDVLIPRPETEFVLVALFDRAKTLADQESISIVDVGCGSGVLAICAALHLPAARVTAVDISPAALEIAQDNACRLGVDSRIAFVQGDLLDALPVEQAFDFVISNPPYISESEYANLPAHVGQHEPKLALLAGAEGDEIIRRLAPQAAQRLRSGGALICEMSPMIAARVRSTLIADDRFEHYSVVKDLAGQNRVAVAVRV